MTKPRVGRKWGKDGNFHSGSLCNTVWKHTFPSVEFNRELECSETKALLRTPSPIPISWRKENQYREDTSNGRFGSGQLGGYRDNTVNTSPEAER